MSITNLQFTVLSLAQYSCALNWLVIPISLWPCSNRSFALAVCLILMALDRIRRIGFKVLLQTILMGVNAAVMLPLPLCEVVKNKYYSIKY